MSKSTKYLDQLSKDFTSGLMEGLKLPDFLTRHDYYSLAWDFVDTKIKKFLNSRRDKIERYYQLVDTDKKYD